MWPLSVAVALAGPLRWERVAPAPPDARDVVFRDDGPVVRTRDGAAWALRDGGFARVAAPTELSRAADTTLVATGGHVGVLRGQPALVQWLGEGGWGDVEALPVEHATSVAREADGTLWAAGLFGTAAVRAPGGDWRPVAGVRDNLFVRVDPTGGAWFWSSAGDVLHRPDERPALPGPTPWSVAKRTLAVDARGRPVWDQGGIVRGGERLSDLDADLLAVGGEAVWARSGGATFRVADEAAVAVPFPPGKADALGATGDGGAWAVAGGHAWRVAEGEPLGLVRATSPWVRGLAGLTGPRAGDLDGDGLADLLAADAGGRLRAFRQVAGELVDHTVELVDGAPRGSASATCDLDGDGRVEVLLRGVDETGPAWRWLRARSGRLVDATAEVGLPQDDPDLARASGAATCDDLTGDGHPDLAIAGGGAVAGRVWLFANDGTGHLAPVALPARGLQVPGRHTWRLHPGDLDGDGLLDVVLATFWGEGHTVLRGAPDGWRDVSVASGLGGIYATPRASWLADVDGDDALDLVVAGTDEVRVWAGDGLRFADRTAAWGLGEADRGSHVAVLAQLDGDAHPDLVLQHPDGAWRAYTGGPGGFADRARELPALPAERASLVALDLGGDGLDLLVTTPTTAEVLHGAPRALPAATPATSPLHTRWAWTPPGVRASVAAALAAWLAAVVSRRRAPAGPFGWGGLALGGGASLAAGVRALDASPAIALPAAAASLLVPAAWWGIVAVRTKRDAARIVGGYRLGRVLGEGASGVVFEARSVATGERVAIKRLRYSLLARPGEREVFRREAELGASVDHPNVVRILGYGEWRAPTDAAPAAWLVLELLGGPTLRDVLDQRGPLPCGDAAGLARDLAAGLAAVHAAGVLHRDVKPQNVAFAGDGTVKLMDFGAARPTARRTETVDRFFGTVGYLSPERLRGEPATVRSDVYALGVVLYECIAGARPGDDLAALATPTAPARPARPDLPDALWAAVARAIDPDPEARFPSAEAFADALAPFACRAPPPALPRGPVAPPAPVASHLATAWGLARAYLRYAWDGGRPDADAFAARWLSRSGEAPPAEPTNRRDP